MYSGLKVAKCVNPFGPKAYMYIYIYNTCMDLYIVSAWTLWVTRCVCKSAKAAALIASLCAKAPKTRVKPYLGSSTAEISWLRFRGRFRVSSLRLSQKWRVPLQGSSGRYVTFEGILAGLYQGFCNDWLEQAPS